MNFIKVYLGKEINSLKYLNSEDLLYVRGIEDTGELAKWSHYFQ